MSFKCSCLQRTPLLLHCQNLAPGGACHEDKARAWTSEHPIRQWHYDKSHIRSPTIAYAFFFKKKTLILNIKILMST